MQSKIKKFFLLFLTVIVATIWYTVFYFENHQNLTVTFFDIGQGDALLIETSAGQQILIDGGPGRKILSKISKALPFYDRSLDVVIATHPDLDHIGGLPDVLNRYEVDFFIEPGVSGETPSVRS